VIAGSGALAVTVDGGGTRTVEIDGTPRSYRLVEDDDPSSGTLDVQVPKGVQVYSFTFG
jgi:hypothetical protein